MVTSVQLKQLRTAQDCLDFRALFSQRSVVLVPTMGALHAGHEALINMAKQHGDAVVVSVFVNPTQFGPNEDFEAYPRTLDADLAICERLGVDAVFTPSVEVVYPNGYLNETGQAQYTQVNPPPELERQLCGLTRPGHFTGVCSVVLRLLMLTQCNKAVFGEKDAQQLAIIQRMVSDLSLPVEIIPHPIVREENGLAMSSRNRYFSTPQQLEASLVLSQTLLGIQALLIERKEQQKQRAFDEIEAGDATLFSDIDMLDIYHAQLKTFSPEAAALLKLDYLSMVNDDTFEPLTEYAGQLPLRVLMAAYVGDVRLIDNLRLI